MRQLPASAERLVASFADHSLGPGEADQLITLVVGGNTRKLSSAARRELAALSERYASRFTRAGAASWKKATGIDVVGGAVRYPEAFLPAQTLLALRAAVGKASSPSEAEPAWAQRLDARLLTKLALPADVIRSYLESSDSAVVQSVCAEIAEAETRRGDNDGRLVPRDLDGAGAIAQAVMQRVWRALGKKKLPLETIRPEVPKAVSHLLSFGQNRVDPRFAALYRDLTSEALRWIAVRYREEVLGSGSRTPGEFLATVGFASPSTRARLRRALPDMFAKPDLEETAKLWAAYQRGDLSSSGFYEITQLRRAELLELRTVHPQLFPDVDETESDAAAPTSHGGPGRRKRIAAGAEYSRRALAIGTAMRKLLAADVLMTGGDLLAQLNRDRDLVRRYGTVNKRIIERARQQYPDLVPSMKGEASWLPALTPELVALMRRAPTLTREQALEALRPRHPRIAMYHIARIAELNAGLFRTGRVYEIDGEAQAKTVAAKAAAYLADDALLLPSEIVGRLNRDTEYLRSFGRITRKRYGYLAGRYPALFPSRLAEETWMPALREEVAALLGRSPGLSRQELVERLRPRHPRINISYVRRLAKQYPGLVPNSHAEYSARDTYGAARAISRLLAREPGLKYVEAAERLKKRYPWLDKYAVVAVVKQYRRELFGHLDGLARYGRNVPARDTVPVRRLYSLVLRLLPPGSSLEAAATALNAQLERRGLPPYTPTALRNGDLESQLDVMAQTTSRVVAEYARSAQRGASEEEILAAVFRDYPSLSPQDLGRYRQVWLDRPRQFAELAPYFSRGRLALVGQGEEVASPRYLGGWELERSVLGGTDEELTDLMRLSQFARIPLRLPMLEAELETVGTTVPLARKNLLVVSHLLATSVPLMLAYSRAGASKERTVIVGTPYGSNREVCETLRAKEFDVRVPRLSVVDYKATVERALDDVVAQYRENHQPIIVMDDGGLVTTLLHEKRKYADVIDAFKIVEQTTGGIILAEVHDLKTPVINLARAPAKQIEGRFVGVSVAAKVLQAVTRAGKSIRGANASVLGYGTIGRAVAQALRQAGARVTVIESSPERQAGAKDDGFAVVAEKDGLAKAAIVIGCTGTQSLSLADLERLPSGAFIASASSKQVEFAMDELKKAASAAEQLPTGSPIVTLPNVRYRLGRAELTVIGDGWPVNFDGDVEDIPAEEIQLTRALQLIGVLQAVSLMGKPRGLVPLDRQRGESIGQRFAAASRLSTGCHPLRDPGRWRDVVRDLFGDIQRAVGGAAYGEAS